MLGLPVDGREKEIKVTDIISSKTQMQIRHEN
jgi:hypothetical protein